MTTFNIHTFITFTRM